MQLIPMTLAGAAGRHVYINPEQVVCIFDLGDRRTQVVTTGLQGESSITLVLDMAPAEAVSRLLDPEHYASPANPARAAA